MRTRFELQLLERVVELVHDADVVPVDEHFAAAWPEGASPPRDEPGRDKSTDLGDGTGFGPPVEMKVTGVKRNVGAIRASVSVRYTK